MTKKPYLPPEAENVKLIFSQVLATSDPLGSLDNYVYEDLGTE